ncbi:MAG TPA: ClpXP protease specificity-enhancing factor [Thermomonas sp.]|nr:ClpXP protease specificity-enhancing factor [Thermomonas sp.]
MSSQRPYLLRALYEWIADNGMTPHVLVDARMPGVRVPAHAVKDGRIVLNIAERAVAKLELGNDAIRFTARFAGVSQAVMVPLEAVIAIYSRETGQGMAMPDEPRASPPVQDDGVEVGQAVDTPPGHEPETPDTPPEPPRRGGHLRIVK